MSWGYAGGTEIDIAVEKGEVIVVPTAPLPTLARTVDTCIRRVSTAILSRPRARENHAQSIRRPFTNFRAVQGSANSRRVAKAVLAAGFWPSYDGDTGHAPERVKILRELRQDLERPGGHGRDEKGRMMSNDSRRGSGVAILKEIFDSPREVLDRVKKLLATRGNQRVDTSKS